MGERHRGPHLCQSCERGRSLGSLALRRNQNLEPKKSWETGRQEERKAGEGSWVPQHVVRLPTPVSSAWQAGTEGTDSLFLPRTSGAASDITIW